MTSDDEWSEWYGKDDRPDLGDYINVQGIRRPQKIPFNHYGVVIKVSERGFCLTPSKGKRHGIQRWRRRIVPQLEEETLTQEEDA